MREGLELSVDLWGVARALEERYSNIANADIWFSGFDFLGCEDVREKGAPYLRCRFRRTPAEVVEIYLSVRSIEAELEVFRGSPAASLADLLIMETLGALPDDEPVPPQIWIDD